MKIAVLMSTYNGEKYLREQIESILCQESLTQIDIWVRDDGSKDTTTEILEEYAAVGKLKWYTSSNMGPAHSFIDLVKHCGEYDYYAFADQDDYWMPKKIQSGISYIEKMSVPALYFANAEMVDSELTSLGRNVYNESPKLDFYTLCCAGGLLGCTMIFNHRLAEIVQLHEQPEAMVMHDFYLAVLCKLFGGEIVYDNQPQMKYRQHGNNVVGVNHGSFTSRLKSKLGDIFITPSIGIDKQADSILKLYSKVINDVQHGWLQKIALYKQSFGKRFGLAVSLKTKYASLKKGILLRLTILAGNR